MGFYKNTACGTPLRKQDQEYKNDEIGSYLYIDPKSGKQKSIRFKSVLTRSVKCNNCIFGDDETGICNQIAAARLKHTETTYIHPLCMKEDNKFSYMIFEKI